MQKPKDSALTLGASVLRAGTTVTVFPLRVDVPPQVSDISWSPVRSKLNRQPVAAAAPLLVTVDFMQ